MRKVLGNSLSRVRNGCKPFLGVRTHKTENLRHAGQIDSRGDVDQDEGGENVAAIAAFGFAFGEKRSNSAEGRAHYDWLCSRLPRNFDRNVGCIGGVIRELVRAARDPFGIAMPPLIERIGFVALSRNLFRRRPPGMARLAAAMQQQHGGAAASEDIGNELVTSSARENGAGGC